MEWIIKGLACLGALMLIETIVVIIWFCKEGGDGNA